MKTPNYDQTIPHKKMFQTIGTAATTLYILAACAGPPRMDPNDTSFMRFGGEEIGTAVLEVQRPWWSVFSDPALDDLIDVAVSRNFDVASALARLSQAEQFVRLDRSDRLPQVSARGTGLADDEPGQSADSKVSGSAAASWEIDLWGRIRRAEEAAAFEALAAAADVDAVRLLVASAVARAYFDQRAQRNQLALLDSQLEASRTQQRLIELRFAQGLTGIVDVLQQREQTASVTQRIPPAEAALRAAANRLDVLLGRLPDAAAEASDGQLTPPVLDWSEAIVPAEWNRRPDLRRLRHLVLAADRSVGVALLDRLPSLNLAADAGGTLDDGVRGLSVSALIDSVLPIIDGGARRSIVEIRRAEFDSLLNAYWQASLLAAEEVRTARHNAQQQVRLIELIDERLELSRVTLAASRQRYFQGQSDYLPVLTALRDVQDLERDRISAVRALIDFAIDVEVALGGGGTPQTQTSMKEASL